MDAADGFRVRVRVESTEDVALDPAAFETTFRYGAPAPGTDEWLFFREFLWRGEVNDHDHVRRFVEDHLGVAVTHVEFRTLRPDREYVDALREHVADDLDAFNADDVDAALSKYLGSRIDVVADPRA